MNEEKKAFAVKVGEDGKQEVIASYEGQEAVEAVKQAEENGLEVVKDREKVEELSEQQESPTLENEWDLISVLVAEIQGFVDEVDHIWYSQSN